MPKSVAEEKCGARQTGKVGDVVCLAKPQSRATKRDDSASVPFLGGTLDILDHAEFSRVSDPES